MAEDHRGLEGTGMKTTLSLKLTKEQSVKLNRLWQEHGENGGAIIMQPVLNFCSSEPTKPFLRGGVVDGKCVKEISAAMTSFLNRKAKK